MATNGDSLRPARGILIGAALSVALWSPIALIAHYGLLPVLVYALPTVIVLAFAHALTYEWRMRRRAKASADRLERWVEDGRRFEGSE